MTDSTKPSAASGSDDPWEKLAEDLFGLEFGKEHAAVETPAPEPAPVPAADEPPFEPEPRADVTSGPIEEPPVAEEKGEPAPQYADLPVRPATHSAQDSYWDALANFNWGESERPVTRSRPSESRRDEPPRGPAPKSQGEGR